MFRKRHQWIRSLTVGLAFAAIAVPTAQARIVEDTGIAPSSQPSADYNGYGYQHGPGVPVDQQADYNGSGYQHGPGVPVDQQISIVRPDDRAARFSPGGREQPQVVAAPSTGFSWGDAGIGAGTAAGLVLLVVGAGLASRRLGRGKALAGA